MSQSRLGSMAEVAANILTGMAVSWVLTIYALPAWGFEPSAGQALEITILYTVVSMARSYCWRRAFNRWGAPQPVNQSGD